MSYRQIAVFGSAVESPFNDWTDRHVAQGFAWRPESVSFGAVEEGDHTVTVAVADRVGPVDADAVRVIDVPFDVPDNQPLEIASISDSAQVTVPPGRYLLRCEFLQRPGIPAVLLTFAAGSDTEFRIVLADAELSPEGELLTTAEPALP